MARSASTTDSDPRVLVKKKHGTVCGAVLVGDEPEGNRRVLLADLLHPWGPDAGGGVEA